MQDPLKEAKVVAERQKDRRAIMMKKNTLQGGIPQMGDEGSKAIGSTNQSGEYCCWISVTLKISLR